MLRESARPAVGDPRRADHCWAPRVLGVRVSYYDGLLEAPFSAE